MAKKKRAKGATRAAAAAPAKKSAAKKAPAKKTASKSAKKAGSKSAKQPSNTAPAIRRVDELEARAISLVDERGRKRLSLACSAASDDSPGHAVAHFFDGEGRVGLTLQLSDGDGPCLLLWGRNGAPAIHAGAHPAAEGAVVTIADAHGRPGFSVHVRDSNASDEGGSRTTISLVDARVRRVVTGPAPQRPARSEPPATDEADLLGEAT